MPLTHLKKSIFFNILKPFSYSQTYCKAAHQKGALYLATNPPKEELTATRLGRLRVEIKKHLSPDMKEIDKIVKKLIDN